MQLTPRDKRMVQVLGVVGGLAVAYFLFTSVLGGGGDEGEVAIPTGPTGVVIIPTGPTGTVSPAPAETLPPVVLAGARDPFSTPPELLTTSATTAPTTGTIPPGSTGTTTTSTVTTSTTSTSTFTFPPPTTSTSTFTTTTGTTTMTTTSPGGNGDGNPDEPSDRTTIGEHDVRLVGVDRKQGRVEVVVDGKLYTVEEGATFEGTFKLVNITSSCARFLFGDQSFTLCLRD